MGTDRNRKLSRPAPSPSENIAAAAPHPQNTNVTRLFFAFVFALTIETLPAGPVLQKNIPFLGPDRKETMDAYLPSDSFARPLPAVIFIHGGGWAGGSKSVGVATGICRTLAENGYAAFSIDYRLNTATKTEDGKTRITKIAWPENFHDCKTAVRYVRQNAKDFGVDPDRIAVMGASARGPSRAAGRLHQGFGKMERGRPVSGSLQRDRGRGGFLWPVRRQP